MHNGRYARCVAVLSRVSAPGISEEAGLLGLLDILAVVAEAVAVAAPAAAAAAASAAQIGADLPVADAFAALAGVVPETVLAEAARGNAAESGTGLVEVGVAVAEGGSWVVYSAAGYMWAAAVWALASVAAGFVEEA